MISYARKYNKARHGDVYYIAASPPFRTRACWLALGYKMNEHEERNQKIVERLAEAYKKVHDEDVQQLLVTEKYSHWLVVFATAGLAIALVRSESITSVSWLGAENAKVIFIIIGVIFLVCAGVGAAIKRITRSSLSYNRSEISLLLRQSILFDPPEHLMDTPELFNKVQKGGFLSEEEQNRIKECREKSESLETLNDRLIITQELLTASGYIGILVCSIPA